MGILFSRWFGNCSFLLILPHFLNNWSIAKTNWPGLHAKKCWTFHHIRIILQLGCQTWKWWGSIVACFLLSYWDKSTRLRYKRNKLLLSCRCIIEWKVDAQMIRSLLRYSFNCQEKYFLKSMPHCLGHYVPWCHFLAAKSPLYILPQK